MSLDGFLAYDPYLSFAEGSRGFQDRIFLRTDGKPSAAWYGDLDDGKGYLSSLWRIGREAYATIAKKIDGQPTLQFFKDAADYIRELEKDYLPAVRGLIEDGRLTLMSEDLDDPVVADLARALEGAQDGWVLNCVMRTVRPSIIAGQIDVDDCPDFELLLLILALFFLDDYIIAENIGAAGLDMNQDLVQDNIASAILYRETVGAAKAALSAQGRKSAKARHSPNNQRKAAALKAWDAYGANVSSMAAFARARHREFEVTERTLYGWIRDHRNGLS